MSTPSLSNLPKAVQQVIVSFLPPGDIDTLERTSDIFKKIINDRHVWEKVARNLNIKVTHKENPRQDVEEAYSPINQLFFSSLTEHGRSQVQKSEDIFLQYKLIQKYLSENPGELQGHRFAKTLAAAVETGNLLLVECLIDTGMSLNTTSHSDF